MSGLKRKIARNVERHADFKRTLVLEEGGEIISGHAFDGDERVCEGKGMRIWYVRPFEKSSEDLYECMSCGTAVARIDFPQTGDFYPEEQPAPSADE